MRNNQVAIIGAGMAGLVAALELASQGLQVTVYDRASRSGGKMHQRKVNAAFIDAGPTVFTMRNIFEEIFDALGESLDTHIRLTPADILARHAWNGHARLDLYANLQQSADAIGNFAGAREARGFLEFSQRAARIYRALETSFIRHQRPSMPGLVAQAAARGIAGLRDLLQISPFTSMQQALQRHFRDPRLQQLFGRYATYCGSSPYQCPATLMLVAHVEQQGVWLVDGGMQRVASALENLARKLGVRFHFDAEVAEITTTNGRTSGLLAVVDGQAVRFAADAVIACVDTNAVARALFGSAAASSVRPTPVKARSLSALTWTMTAAASGFPLQRHNVFFSRNYSAEFEDIFGHHRLPADPTVYVCAQDRGVAAEDSGFREERLLVLVNAPANGDMHEYSESEIAACEETTLNQLSRCGLILRRHPGAATVTTPSDWNRLYPATGGALYGRASHGWMASFQRPHARSRLPGLYLAGGSAHPGPGIAMAAVSGRLAAQALMADRCSTKSFHAMGMSGGMSTQ